MKSLSQLTANLFNRFTHSIINVKSLEHAEFCKLIDSAIEITNSLLSIK